MPAFDWSTPHAALVSAIAGTSGALASNGQDLADRLEDAGTYYDQRWAATGSVDGAKTAWTAAATDAWDDADRVARHILDPFFPSPLSALTFDAHDRSALIDRVRDALDRLGRTDQIRTIMNAASTTLTQLWDPNVRFPESHGFEDASLHPFIEPVYSDIKYLPSRKLHDSPRTLELVTAELAAEAEVWTDAVT